MDADGNNSFGTLKLGHHWVGTSSETRAPTTAPAFWQKLYTENRLRMAKLRAYILWRYARQSSVYDQWLDQLPIEHEIVDEDPSRWSVPDNAGIVISHMHYRWDELSALRKITETNRVPVLVLTDGILEYRNTWEHPDLPEGCIFQPLCGAQARVYRARSG